MYKVKVKEYEAEFSNLDLAMQHAKELNVCVTIIWDQTSTTVKSRARKFNMLPDYEHVAVVFKTPEHKELMRRLMSRPGKEIPEHVIASMIASWEDPTEEEGFSEIWYT